VQLTLHERAGYLSHWSQRGNPAQILYYRREGIQGEEDAAEEEHRRDEEGEEVGKGADGRGYRGKGEGNSGEHQPRKQAHRQGQKG